MLLRYVVGYFGSQVALWTLAHHQRLWQSHNMNDCAGHNMNDYPIGQDNMNGRLGRHERIRVAYRERLRQSRNINDFV